MSAPTLTPAFTVPATAMQEALWWVHQRAKNQSVYNLTWRLACAAGLDADALASAWQAVVDRHEALRTAVIQQDGQIRLTVLPRATARLQWVEVDDPGTVPVGTLLRLLAEEVHEQSLPLEVAPLARLTMVRVGTEHELVLTVHHVVLDGWAIQLLFTDLSAAYEAAVDDDQPSFGTEPVPFSVYARESIAARDSGDWQASLDYWREALAGAVSTTVVADRNSYVGTGAAGVTLRYAFSPDAADGVAALMRATFATPFAVVLAALEIVLARGGAGPDVALGVVVANRMSQRDQELVGYLANLCIARAHIGAEDTVLDVVGRSRDAMWAMLSHQGVPYPVVFGALPESTQAMLNDYAPLLLNYLGPIGAGLRLGDVDMSLHRTPNRAARSDIAIAFWDAADGYLAEIEYNTGRYDQETVLRLLHDLDAVLALGATGPRLPVASVEVRSRSAAGHVDHRPARPTSAGAAAMPESATWERVSRVWADVLAAPPSGPDEDFFTVGGRSLKVIQLAAAIEAETGSSIDLITWLAEPTPRRLVAQLAAAGANPAGDDPAGSVASTLVRLRDGDGPHLHLVHGAGGSPQDYRDLLAALPAHWRVTLSQEREPLRTVPAMAVRYRADLDAAGLRPDVLAGWSMGAQICYELATGYPAPAPALALLDGAPPVGYERDGDTERLRLQAFAASMGGSLGVETDGTAPRTGGENPELAMRALAAYLGGLGQPVPVRTLVERWDTYRRHTDAVAAFVKAEPVRARTLLVGAELWDVQLDQWAERIEPAPRRLRIPTDHFGVLHGPAAAAVSAAIQELCD